ncbi:hypothetical protein [Parvibium lacunae]|uniref:Lipoprotein n=1 Tax=Parvibium lacunae TaxID=1888893 RepID=A0A368L1X7_9BURK|nr:hypothetical protein [Parvibium lacunae]RCS57493.1 hypothetical protein DU000_08575 [Parvibium lacunae]
MKKRFFIALITLLPLFAFAGRQELLVDPIQEPIGMLPDASTPSADRIQRSLLAAAARLGWVIQPDGVGGYDASLSLRSHRVIVNITISNNQFIVKYKESTNLNYEVTSTGTQIHPSYQKWVKNLINETRSNLVLTK